ncbi:unnamed protein product [Vitrella brassicaformis CCMP3155]|uniref:Potassium channel tetramerisation-type BTB domain-containing protein n=2 Tax=Vitrella brassicaformis TaxID=1169539 RepID=A0A0G4EJS5_VITBC|nr:unnamed protein product [Vitrella brassicaformis CCMP3155]|eukprot:CEL96792.1 unnamed protein product [Vitrella brassicaformis CCMP3155]
MSEPKKRKGPPDGDSDDQLPFRSTRPAFVSDALRSIACHFDDAGRALAFKQQALEEMQIAKQRLLNDTGWREDAAGDANQKLYLSVGGTQRDVPRGWLTKKADSLLAFIFSGHLDGRLVRCTDGSNRIFLDLDGAIFDKFLDALATFDGSSRASQAQIRGELGEAFFFDALLNNPLPNVTPSPGPPPSHTDAPAMPPQMLEAMPSGAAIMEDIKSVCVGYMKEHAAIDAQIDDVKCTMRQLEDRMKLAEPWLQPSTGGGVGVVSLSVVGMTLSTTTATVEACGGDDSPFANRFNGSSLDATSPAIVRKAINFARQHRLAPSQSLAIPTLQGSSANGTLELRRTLEMFGLIGPHGHCVQRIAPSTHFGGPGMGMLAGRAELNRLVGWLEEEWNKPVEDIRCTYSCSSATAYDGAAFLASIPAPEAEKGWVFLLKKGQEVVGAACPLGLKKDTKWLRAGLATPRQRRRRRRDDVSSEDDFTIVDDDSDEDEFPPTPPREPMVTGEPGGLPEELMKIENADECTDYHRSSQEPIPFLCKLADPDHPDTVTKTTGDRSRVVVSKREPILGDRALKISVLSLGEKAFFHGLSVHLTFPFYPGVCAFSQTERPLLSGAPAIQGCNQIVRGGWDLVEVWQVSYMGQRATT